MGAITRDPADLVPGRRYVMRHLDHPERPESEGAFDGLRESEWEEAGDELHVFFTDGRIGDVPQRIFGFPSSQRREFREVA